MKEKRGDLQADLESMASRMRARGAVLRDQRIAYRNRQEKDGRKRNRTITMDVESTGLCHGSTPVEIGLCIREDGYETSSFTTLVAPLGEWVEEGRRTQESNEIHGIPEHHLKNGMEPWKICEVLDVMLGGETVSMDGGSWDSYWISRLYEGRTPAFQIKYVNGQLEDHDTSSGGTTEHRALPDARKLAKTIEEHGEQE